MMNLETKLDRRLWDAIRSSVEGRNFKSAVLDAIHVLTDVIRERSGLEGDGVALVGAAFGGSSPKLKVNRLQTESERNVQSGTEAMLRGLYQAIRNPRSHEQFLDNDRDAQAIILFIDYLLRIVDQSRSPFSLPTIVARVLDPDFVPSERYSTLLVNQIPTRKRLAVCHDVFARREEADPQKVRYFFGTILKHMAAEEVGEFCALLSDELRRTDDDDTIRFVLCCFPSSMWPDVDEDSRLRIENKLINSVRDGRWWRGDESSVQGSLGTWATNIADKMILKGELWLCVFGKLGSADRAEQDYVFQFFMQHVEHFFPTPPPALIRRINEGLRAGDVRFRDRALVWESDFAGQRDPADPWRQAFAEALTAFTERPEAELPCPDEMPF